MLLVRGHHDGMITIKPNNPHNKTVDVLFDGECVLTTGDPEDIRLVLGDQSAMDIESAVGQAIVQLKTIEEHDGEA